MIQQKLLRKECTGESEKLTRGIREMRKIKPYIESDMLIENRPWTPLWQTKLSFRHLPSSIRKMKYRGEEEREEKKRGGKERKRGFKKKMERRKERC